MRHRLYYLQSDSANARRTLDDLLLARIEERHIRFMTDGRPLAEGLPEASLFHKTDALRAASLGMLCGVGLGLGLALLLLNYFQLQEFSALVFLVSTMLGMLFGGWAASLIGVAVPGATLRKFQPELAKGRILLIVDVPARRLQELEQMLQQRHPEMQFCGEDAHRPVFP